MRHQLLEGGSYAVRLGKVPGHGREYLDRGCAMCTRSQHATILPADPRVGATAASLSQPGILLIALLWGVATYAGPPVEWDTRPLQKGSP